MRSLALMLLLMPFVLLRGNAQGDPGPIQMTPHGDLGLRPTKLHIPAKLAGKLDSTLIVNLPPGFSAQLFWIGGLKQPRFMTWGPDSVLYVANLGSGQVIALPDRDHDGVADTSILAASGVVGHDVKFYNGAMYVATEHQVIKLRDTNNDGFYETRALFIDSVGMHGEHPTGGHVTRTIVFDSLHGKLYLSVGSSCNVCRETGRDEIEEYNIDGTGRRVYATGLRNAVGMTLHPRTGRLWADNNGSDLQGNDIPPEWIDLVRDGGFYGFPIAYAHGVYFNYAVSDYASLLPITSADSARVRTMVQPAALVQAHSAPMAIEFADESFPAPYRHGAFVALHGSWNRTPATGVKVIYLDFDSDADTTANFAADFMTGFMTDSVNTIRWGRPVGLETDSRGRLYVGSDDGDQCIIVVSPDTASTSSVPNDPDAPSFGLQGNAPNPFRVGTTISFALAQAGQARLTVLDALGHTVATLVDGVVEAGSHAAYFEAGGLAEGTYFCRLELPDHTEVRTMTLIK